MGEPADRLFRELVGWPIGGLLGRRASGLESLWGRPVGPKMKPVAWPI